ncbi:MAG: hypothetical protein IJ911_10720 [Salinivirgaceae bacterium]|nr:hypothetical protein [Salinivirgaceae bacterium]
MKRKIRKEKTKKAKQVLSTGCLVIATLFFLFVTISTIAMFATNEPAASGGIPVVIMFALIVLVLWVFRKRSYKENVQAVKDKRVDGDELNINPIVNEEVEIDECEQKIMQLKKDIDNLKTEDKEKKDCFESISAAVKAECGNWEEQMKEILEMLPHEAEPERKIDSLIESAAKNAVFWQSVSAETIQRKFAIGYNRACEIIEQMEQFGIIAKNEKGDYDVLCENEDELKSLLKEENIIQ